jgi:hypothetical protein
MVEVSQEQEPAVGGETASGDVDVDRFAGNERKVLDGLRIRHGRMFRFCASSWSLNLLYARQAKHPFFYRRPAPMQTAAVSGMS